MRMVTQLLTLSIMLLPGCTCNQIKARLLPSFDVTIPEIKLTVPPLPIVTDKEMPLGSLSTHINMDSTIRARTAGTFGAGAVHIVKVKRLEIRAVNADSKTNLSNFRIARMRIYTDTTAADIAVVNFPEVYADSITVIPENTPDISDYLRGTDIHYNLFWQNRKTTHKYLQLSVRVTVAVQ